MLSKELIVVLLAGMILMSFVVRLQMRWYSYDAWKSLAVVFVLVLTGVCGSELWFFIENGAFGGRSLYGAIAFSPLTFYPLARLLHIRYREILDFCAPAGCLTLGLVKLQCLRDHCCEGMILGVNENHMYVRFPSQILEMIVFLIISGVLLYLASKPVNRGKIFPMFLVVYGATRFAMDFLREYREIYLLGLSAGSFWSLCSVLIGGAILLFELKKRRKHEESLAG